MSGRIRRLESHRFIGDRESMTVFDTDDPEQLRELEERIALRDLVDLAMVSTFAPDSLIEAVNRGFRPR